MSQDILVCENNNNDNNNNNNNNHYCYYYYFIIIIIIIITPICNINEPVLAFWVFFDGGDVPVITTGVGV